MSRQQWNSVTNNSSPSYVVLGLCLLLAVTMCSSAGVVFDILTTQKNVSPFLAAFWRLWIQNTIQLIPFLLSLRKAWRSDKEKKALVHYRQELLLQLESTQQEEQKLLTNNDNDGDEQELLLPRYVQSLPLCGVSGIFLGMHFSMWVYSLRYTSLTHSLLWVSMGPIVLNGGSWILYHLGRQRAAHCPSLFESLFKTVHKPGRMETIGVLVGISGAIAMLLGVKRRGLIGGDTSAQLKKDHSPTLYGDAAAFSGAVTVCFYLIIGQKLRSFLPIWLYVFPVIAAATVTCLLFAIISEDSFTVYGFTEQSMFGFLSKDYIVYAFYLGAGPGIAGHTLLNVLLKHISPLVVTTAMLMEPILGSIIGYFCGLQGLPDATTWCGGGILLLGLVLVVTGENLSNEGDQQQSDKNSNDLSIQSSDGSTYGSTGKSFSHQNDLLQ